MEPISDRQPFTGVSPDVVRVRNEKWGTEAKRTLCNPFTLYDGYPFD